MSIERQFKLVMFICDECGDESTPDEDFNTMKDDAKSDGWLIQKDEDTDEYTHLCPDCVKLLPSVT